ncbi:pote ankyrin domain [Holotrichia oblita]|uniref:Pote ankyrin domain n=1 Tax=Holotrichia oblita TaxID=644536 RepID=A0ACB9SJ34_HOLOL|nr:pote ankyrin domain [Holotrichia oblita]
MADRAQGYKYQLSVPAYLASLLSKDEIVQDYHIFYEIQEVKPFDDIVLAVQYNDSEAFRLYFVQVKSGKVKLDVNTYLNAYKRITENKRWECLRNRVSKISEGDIQFWYFACKRLPPQPIPFLEGKLEIRKRELTDEKLIIKKKNVYELLSKDEAIARKYQDFFKDFYIFLDQDDTNTIANKLKGMWALNDTSPIIDYLDKYFIKNKRESLGKADFEHELLRIRLWDSIVKPTKIVSYQKQSAVAWNDLTLSYNATIVKNELDIEIGLFSCILRSIDGIITVEQWNTCVDNDGTLSKEVKSKFASRFYKPETLKDLLVYLWRCGKIPLILKSDNTLPQLKDFLNLNQHYIIIDSDPDKRYDEMKRYSLTAIKDLEDTTAEPLLQSVLVSMQGRQPVPLHTVINSDKRLMQTLTCLDIFKLIEPRQVYLSKDCLEAYNYTLFIIETVQPEASNYEDYDPHGDNFCIYCPFDQSNEVYEKVKRNIAFKNYNIYGLRLENDKLKLIRRFDENKLHEGFQGLETFQIDQYGNSVYNINGSHAVPIIGEVTRMSCSKYLRRYLCKETRDNKRYGDDETTDSTIKFSETIFSDKNFFKEMDGKICVVVGEAGIGKTTFLQALTQTCDPQYYLLFCNLPQFQVDMRDNFQRLLKDPLSFLWSKQRLLLYDHFLNTLRKDRKRLILLLDSFDEVISTCKEQVLALIRKLNEEACIKKLIIGSRLLTVQLLADQFATIKITKVEEFSKKNNGQYFENWNLDEHRLQGMPTEFTTNPLYLDMLQKISQNSGIDFQRLSRWTLYNCIVDSEIERYSRRRNLIDEYEREHLLRIHRELALKSIFGNNQVTQKFNQERLMKFTNATRLGMIKFYDENEDPVFVHHTFAEFFTAQWLIETTDKEDAKLIYKLMVDERRHNILDIYSEQYPLHKAVLNADNWNVESFEQIEKLLTDNKEVLLQTDGIGRSALHIIGTRYSHHIDKCLDTVIHYMLEEGYDLYSLDKLLNWTWIEYSEHFSKSFITKVSSKFYAIHEAYWRYYASLSSTKCIDSSIVYNSYQIAVNYFLPGILADLVFIRYFDNEDFIRFRNLCLSSDVLDEKLPEYFESDKLQLKPLHLAVIYSNINVVRACIRRGDKLTVVDRFGCTPLYHAVLKQNSEIVKLLLKKGSGKLKKRESSRINTFQLSLMIGNEDITKMLTERMDIKQFGSDWLCDAIRFGDIDVIALLLKTKINPNIRRSEGEYRHFLNEIYYRDALTAVRKCCDYNYEVSTIPLDDYLSITDAFQKMSRGFTLVSNLPLNMAIHARRTDIVRLLLNKGVNVNTKVICYDYVHTSKQECSPLCCAIRSWNIDTIELLLQHGAIVNYISSNDLAPLITAICQNIVKVNNDYFYYQRTGDYFRKRLYNEFGTDVLRVVNKLDWSLSRPAFLNRRLQIVEILLRYGADVNFKDENGLAPLEKALNTQNWMIVEMLLLHGAHPNELKEWRFTDILAVLPIENINIIQLLLKNGADPNFESTCAVTPLYVTARRRQPDMVRILFENTASADITTCTRTLLTRAKENGEVNDVRLLLDVTEMCFVGPIYDADYPIEVLTLLHTVTNQDSINFANEIDITCDVNNTKLIKELLRYAADLTNPNGIKYLNAVLELNKQEVDQILLNYFWDHYAECTAFYAAQHKNKTMIEILTRNGRGVNNRDECGDIALVSTIRNCMDKSVVKFLLENEADVNLADKYGISSLRYAIAHQRIDIIELFLKCNAKINYVEQDGFTPLLHGIYKNNVTIIRILLDYGADVNFTGDYGITPLYAAAMKGDPEIIKTLFRYGPKSNIETSGNTLLYKAIQSDCMIIVQLLLSAKYSPIFGNYEVIQRIYHNRANVNAVYEFGLTPLHLATKADVTGWY